MKMTKKLLTILELTREIMQKHYEDYLSEWQKSRLPECNAMNLVKRTTEEIAAAYTPAQFKRLITQLLSYPFITELRDAYVNRFDFLSDMYDVDVMHKPALSDTAKSLKNLAGACIAAGQDPSPVYELIYSGRESWIEHLRAKREAESLAYSNRFICPDFKFEPPLFSPVFTPCFKGQPYSSDDYEEQLIHGYTREEYYMSAVYLAPKQTEAERLAYNFENIVTEKMCPDFPPVENAVIEQPEPIAVISEAKAPVIEEPVIEEAEEEYIEEDFIDEEDEDFIEEEYIDEEDEDGFEWSIEDIEQPTELITEAVLPEAAEPTIEEPAVPETEEQHEPIDIMPETENINDNADTDINIENLFEDTIEEPEECCLPATVTVTDIIEANSEIKDKLLFFKAEIDYAKSILYKLGSDKLYKKVKLNKYAQFKTVDTTIQAAGRLIDEHENMMNSVITKSDELLDSGNTEQAEELLIMLIHDARLNEFIRGARTTLDKLYRYCEGSIAYLRVKPAEQKKEVTLASVLEGIQ